jgi:HEAT repeat protein
MKGPVRVHLLLLAAVVSAIKVVLFTHRHVAMLTNLVELLDEDELVAALGALTPGTMMLPGAMPFVSHCLSHPLPAVRLAALHIVAIRPPADPGRLAHLLEDTDPQIRAAAANAFAAYGNRGVAAAAARLEHPRRAVRHAAIMALGAIGGPEARVRLLRALVPHRRFAQQSSAWLDLLRRRDRPAAFEDLAAAVESQAFEAMDTGLAIAAALGGGRLIDDLRGYLVARDPRRRADALEALASLGERTAVKALLPLLERQIRRDDAPLSPAPAAAWHQMMQVAAGHSDPWIRRAAQRARIRVGSPIQRRGSPPTARDLAKVELPVDRILSLRHVAMFRSLPLDTLLRLDRMLEQRAFLDGEVVIDPLAGGRHLCILLRGAVLLDRPGLPPRLLEAVATFGESAVVDDHMPQARAVARGSCAVLLMSAVTFNDLVGEHPEIWVEVCKQLARHLDAEPKEPAVAA